MAVLKVIQGSCPGQLIELHGERTIMGRHPNCHIVLDNAAVSRNHAQILENHGSYYLEDLRSRNGTLINGQRIRGRTQLSEGDEFKVCDVLFRFFLGAPPIGESSSGIWTTASPLVADSTLRPTTTESAPATSTAPRTVQIPQFDDEEGDGSSILSAVDMASLRHPSVSVRPEVKLRAVLEISNNLASTLDLAEVLPKILESLFKIFPQADRGFVVLKDQESGELQVKATKVRNERDDLQRVRLSTTILREAMSKARALLSADAAHDGRFDQSESVANLRIRSLMCAPLVNQEGHALGAIQVDTLDMRQQFLQEDLDVLASVAAQAGMAVENANLHTTTMRQRDLERELEFATQVQLGFLPTERPRLDGYEFYDFYEAAYRVGGDFFDYVMLPGGQVAIGLGDVAGKGIPAALLMARLYSSARYELLTKPTVAGAMSGLNVDVSMGGLGHRFVTLVFAILDPKTHRLTLSNAGHIPPLVRNSRGQVTKIAAEEAGLPLGIDSDIVYDQCEVTLEPGDTLVLLTDGVTEAMNPQNEIYGMSRLTKFLETAPDDADALGEALVEDVEAFSEGRAQRDDICLICFRRLPELP